MSTLLDPQKKEIRMVLFPLGVGNPCVYYPRGLRQGDAKPAMMMRRENEDVITLLEHRHGQGVMWPCVRHADDPYFVDHPNSRNASASGGGAWDYSPGLFYSWYVPGKPLHVSDFPVIAELGIAPLILHMANELADGSKIANHISRKGVTKAMIDEFLAMQRVPETDGYRPTPKAQPLAGGAKVENPAGSAT